MLLQILLAYIDTSNIYKKGKKVRKYKGEVYRSTGARGSNRGCFSIANIADVADIVTDIADITTDIADIVVEIGRRV